MSRYNKLEDLPKYGEQEENYENPFKAYTPCRDSILQMLEDGAYESIEQGLCEVNGFEQLANYDAIPLDLDSWIFITNPIFQSDKKNHLRYMSVRDDEQIDLNESEWEIEEHNRYRLYVNKQDWAEFVKVRKNEMSKYVNHILKRDLELKDVIDICKRCDYCDIVYFYNEETEDYDEKYLSCANDSDDCEYTRLWD